MKYSHQPTESVTIKWKQRVTADFAPDHIILREAHALKQIDTREAHTSSINSSGSLSTLT